MRQVGGVFTRRHVFCCKESSSFGTFVQILLCFYVSPFVFKIPKIIFLEEREELLVRLRTVLLLL